MKTLAGNDAGRASAAGDLLQPGILVLVIGGAASGKSAFAEGLAVRMHALSAGKEAGESEKAAAGAVVPAGADSVREDPAAAKEEPKEETAEPAEAINPDPESVESEQHNEPESIPEGTHGQMA